MGFLRESFQVLRSPELKELKRTADARPRQSMLEGLRMANAAVQQANIDPAKGGVASGLYLTGVPGSATVQALRETGTRVDGAPILELDLLVTVPGREPYPVTHRRLISFAELGALEPGAVVGVRVDPADPNTLVVG